MEKVTNAKILAELWEEDKAHAIPAKSYITHIQALQPKPTKKNPDKVKYGEVTMVLPEDFIGRDIGKEIRGGDMWILFRVNPDDWDAKKKELTDRIESK